MSQIIHCWKVMYSRLCMLNTEVSCWKASDVYRICGKYSNSYPFSGSNQQILRGSTLYAANINFSSSSKQQVCMIHGPQKIRTEKHNDSKEVNYIYDNKMNLSTRQIQKIDVGHQVIYTIHLDLALSISSANIKMRTKTNPVNLAIMHQVILER